MRRLLCIVALILLAGVGALANLVPNPGFEEGAGGVAAVWKVPETGLKGEGGTVANWTTEEAHTGTRSLKMQMTGENEGFLLVATPQLPVKPGFDYEVSFWYKVAGLRAETVDRNNFALLLVDNFVHTAEPIKYLSNNRIWVRQDSPEWQRASLTFHVTEPNAANVQVRLELSSHMAGLKPVAYIDDVDFEPLDTPLPNGGAEAGTDEPERWLHTETGNPAWSTAQAHGGTHSLALTDPPNGKPSGWYMDVPCRPDRKYALAGWVKTAQVNANGTPTGGYLALTYLDATGAALGAAAISPALSGNNDWTKLQVEAPAPPPGAVFLRVAAQMVFCKGTAWFDDLELTSSPAEAAIVQRVPRIVTGPQPGRTYATNLLANPDVEQGANGQPTGWTWVGKSDPDWTAAELDTFYKSGYPNPNLGRGRGEWSEEAFAGRHALLSIPVEPPLSKRFQWYGLGEVDAYWQSDAMPCAPGQPYFAGGWLKITNPLYQTWQGPLRLFFYDANGRWLDAPRPRVSSEPWKPGQWAWYCTAPYIAPAGAVTMRLRFNQALRADNGTFGRMWGDDFAVWAVPAEAQALTVPPPFNVPQFKQYFVAAHQKTLPPYLPAPEFVPVGDTAWVTVDTAQPGNLFFNPQQPTPLSITVSNLLAEPRQLEVALVRYDWQGNRQNLAPLKLSVPGWGQATAAVPVPAAGRFDCYYVETTVAESGAATGSGVGRFAVLPRPTRPRYTPATTHWQVMPLTQLADPTGPYAREFGEMLKLAGYGSVRVNIYGMDKADLAGIQDLYTKQYQPLLKFYRGLGLDITANIYYPGREVAANIARVFGSDIAVWDVGGVEQANHGSPFRATGGMSDEDYDQHVAESIDGIREVLPQATIMSGAIASDMEATVLTRWYAAGIAQKFAGFTYNTYGSFTATIKNNLAMMAAHGEPNKYAWIEEIPAHNAPVSGPERRYGEKAGAANMVRVYVSLLSDFYPRFARITTWSFLEAGADSEYSMVMSDLSPRPSYPAMVVLTDKFGQAKFDQAMGDERLAVYRWREGERTLGVLWSNLGTQTVTLETKSPRVTVTDLMGNARTLPVTGGMLSLPLTEEPVYLEGAGDFVVSRRLALDLTQGVCPATGPPTLNLLVRNTGPQRLGGTVRLIAASAPDPAQAAFDLAPGQELKVPIKVTGTPVVSKREPFRVEATTKEGFTYATTVNLNFARAAHAQTPPAVDGTWKGWEAAPVIFLGDRDRVKASINPGESWTGPADASGKLRLLWDDKYLYLGVEATDDIFKPQPEAGFNGFTGDSLEFALQPDHLLRADVKQQEFELFLPGGQGAPRLNWRFPNRAMTTWPVAVKPTGAAGNVNYQVAIPWAEIGVKAPAAGRTLSLSVVLNDTDTDYFTGGRTILEWFGGLASSGKDPSQYGDLTLCE
ncbi:MAG TPA: sugar-binding protein [Armatimonadota bacterium]|jgi:hypothetical protein